MSAHKDRAGCTITIDGSPPLRLVFRWTWQAWIANRVLGMALGGAR